MLKEYKLGDLIEVSRRGEPCRRILCHRRQIHHTSPDKIKACTVYILNLESQQKIGAFLRSIEDKINLNRQINQIFYAIGFIVLKPANNRPICEQQKATIPQNGNRTRIP